MIKRLLFGGLLLLAACGPDGTAAPTNDPHNPPTTEPPAYVEAAAPVTLDNIAQARYLGRLDQPGSASTLLDHAISPDSTQLAALSNELLLAWNLLTGEMIFSTSRQGGTYVSYSSDKTELYSVAVDGTVRVYDTTQGEHLAQFRGHQRFNDAVAFDPEGGLLALGGDGGTVKVWDTFERLSLVTFSAHPIAVEAVTFSPDGTLLATAADDGTVRVWDWEAGEQVAEFDHEGAAITQVVFSPDGTQLATGTPGYIALWSVEAGELSYALPSEEGGANEALRYSPDGRYLVSGGQPDNMIIWDPVAAEMAAVLPGFGGDRLSAAFSPDGSLLLTSLLFGQTAVWDMTAITEETIRRAPLEVPAESILRVDWTSDGFLLLLFDAAGPVYVWGVGEEA